MSKVNKAKSGPGGDKSSSQTFASSAQATSSSEQAYTWKEQMASASGLGLADDGLHDDRIEKSRERNREHAKKTRLRKKAMLEGMKDRLTELQKENDKLKSFFDEKSTASILLGLCDSVDAADGVAADVDDSYMQIDAVLASAPLQTQRRKRAGQVISPERQQETSRPRGSSRRGGDSASPALLDASKSEHLMDVSNSSRTGEDMASDDDEDLDDDEQYDEQDGDAGGRIILGPSPSATSLAGTIKNTSQLTEKELAVYRKERNRMHAKMTRDRKKVFASKMQQMISALESENNKLQASLAASGSLSSSVLRTSLASMHSTVIHHHGNPILEQQHMVHSAVSSASVLGVAGAAIKSPSTAAGQSNIRSSSSMPTTATLAVPSSSSAASSSSSKGRHAQSSASGSTTGASAGSGGGSTGSDSGGSEHNDKAEGSNSSSSSARRGRPTKSGSAGSSGAGNPCNNSSSSSSSSSSGSSCSSSSISIPLTVGDEQRDSGVLQTAGAEWWRGLPRKAPQMNAATSASQDREPARGRGRAKHVDQSGYANSDSSSDNGKNSGSEGSDESLTASRNPGNFAGTGVNGFANPLAALMSGPLWSRRLKEGLGAPSGSTSAASASMIGRGASERGSTGAEGNDSAASASAFGSGSGSGMRKVTSSENVALLILNSLSTLQAASEHYN